MSAGKWRQADRHPFTAVHDAENRLVANFFDPADARTCVEAVNAQGWRPIESAPRDAPVLLFSPQDVGNCADGLAWVSGGYGITGWRGQYGKNAPTHWMPLPAPLQVRP